MEEIVRFEEIHFNKQTPELSIKETSHQATPRHTVRIHFWNETGKKRIKKEIEALEPEKLRRVYLQGYSIPPLRC